MSIRERAGKGPPVCWLRIGNATNPSLMAWLEGVFPTLSAALEAGEEVIDVR